MSICYQCDHKGFFVGQTSDNGGFLPNNAIYTAPPEIIKGYIPRWTGETWEQVENHRGKEGYLDGKPYKMIEYGPLPTGFSQEAPPKTAEELAAERKAEITNRLAVIEHALQPRCIREKALGPEIIGQEDYDFALQKLASLNAEARTLAAELAGL